MYIFADRMKNMHNGYAMLLLNNLYSYQIAQKERYRDIFGVMFGSFGSPDVE